MGWKAVKNHYRIGHTVQVQDGSICIGSAYISDLIVIDPQGRIVKRPEHSINQDLSRYLMEMDADTSRLARLIQAEDTFAPSITVFTYRGGEILEKACEAPGYPNVTHDGDLMHDNTFSTDKAQVVAWAKRNADIGVKWAREAVTEAEKKLAECRARLAEEEEDFARLGADYPDRAA